MYKMPLLIKKIMAELKQRKPQLDFQLSPYTGTRETNVKPEYNGKLLFCLMGAGKSHMAKDNIKDADMIYCYLLQCHISSLFNKIKGMGQDQRQTLVRRSLSIIKDEIKKGNTVLTGSYLIGKYAHYGFIYHDAGTMIKRTMAGNRKNRRMLSIGTCIERIYTFESICNDHDIPLTDIGNSYLSEIILKK